MFLKPRSLEGLLEEQRQQLARNDQKLSQYGVKYERDTPLPIPGELRLGVFLKGDHFPQELGITRRAKWLTTEERLLDYHWFILGATGAGKSETLKRLIFEIATNTDRDIFLVDGKGEDELAQAVRAICYHGQRGETPIFRLGQIERGHPYNGFMGQPADIYNRLCAMVGVREAEGNAQYYADVNRDLLQLMCFAPEGPPRSFEEVRHRLNIKWLEQAWRDSDDELETLAELKRSKSNPLEGLRLRMRPIARELAPVVRPDGFVLEQARSAIFSIRTQSVGDTAARFLQYFIEDIKDFVGKRQQKDRSAVLIIDEFGSFGNKNILALLTQARSAHVGVVLATQDIASLGDEATTRNVLANTRTKLLMASDFPEEVAKLAGTRYQVESSIQHNEGETTGMGSARIQHAFKIDMNEAGRLQPGEGFIIRQRYAAKLRMARVEQIPNAPAEVLPQEQERDSGLTSAPVEGVEL